MLKLRSVFTVKRLLLVFVLLAIALAFHIAQLDRVVRQQFEGKRFSLPARVYARPLELFVGKPVDAVQLQRELDLLKYKNVGQVRAPAEYALDGGDFVIQGRSFEFWDGLQDTRRVRVSVRRGQVALLMDDVTGDGVDLFRLEPISIGGIYTDKNEDRQLVRYDQVPRHLIDALIAVEDQRFYFHHGVDLRSLGRALVSTVTGRGIQGGSTITQQLVKNFFLTPERTLKRKFNEMWMALILELRYDKNDILETYLNEVYFGQDGSRAIHGVGLAANFHFGRTVEQLEPHQSALLVAMLKGPTLYNPRRNPQQALVRRNLVLAQTREQGYLAEWEYDEAIQKPLDISTAASMGLSQYPAFLDLVFRQLRKDYKESDLRSEGLRIFTTLDPLVQHAAEAAVTSQLAQLEKTYKLDSGWLEGAMVVSAPHTGEVAAVVGSRKPRFEGFNRALDAKRQIGSLIKPAIYLTALEQPERYTLASLLDDDELEWQEAGTDAWTPSNYDNEFHGQVPLWQALAHSYNVSSARLGLELGVHQVTATAQRLGIEAPMQPYASTLLGTSELAPFAVAQMYQTIATGGFRMPLRAIREVLTTDGRPLRRYPIDVQQVADGRAVYLLTRAMQLAVSDGTGRGLQRYLPANLNLAGKTGTTDDLRDSWFAGFSGDWVAVAWIGNDHNQNTRLTGATGAMTVWAQTMAALNPQPLLNSPPDGITRVHIHPETGFRTDRQCSNARELPFIVGSEPAVEVNCEGGELQKRGVRKWFQNLLH